MIEIVGWIWEKLSFTYDLPFEDAVLGCCRFVVVVVVVVVVGATSLRRASLDLKKLDIAISV